MVMSTPTYPQRRPARSTQSARSIRRVETPLRSRAQTGWTGRPSRPRSSHGHGRRVLVLGFLAAGAVLQHIMVSPSPELTLSPARPAGLVSAAPSVQQAPFAAQTLAAARVMAPGAGEADPAGAPTSGRRARVVGSVARPSVAMAGAVPAAPAAASRPAAPVLVPVGGGGARSSAARRAPAIAATASTSAVAAPVQTVTAPGDAALAASIWRAFNTYALPYQADSALLVDVGRQFGIDPAIPAALFMHEDGNINNRALFPDHMNWLLYHTHNPGNIKCMYDPCYGGFQVYPTYRAGILDWFRLYDHYYVDLGIHDLARFVATYCPPNVDGNGPPAGYQSDVQAIAARIHGGVTSDE